MRHPHGPACPRDGPEVADILRDHAFGLSLSREQAHAAAAIVHCRTARLGGHAEVCPVCGFKRHAYNSCRNRHCPKCQILKQELWAEAQRALLLPVVHFQIVFTIPAELHRLFRRAPEVCLTLLFAAVSETLLDLAQSHLNGEIGFTVVLHTWTQRLRFHPHIHCLVPAGALGAQGWIATDATFFLPIDQLRAVFKGKLLDMLRQAVRAGRIPIPKSEARALIARAGRKKWRLKIQPPLAGPAHVVNYLSRYVHRIAITNSRIVDYDGQNVTFRYRDRRDGNQIKHETVSGPEFCRRFLQHVLPDRFVRIRHYGLLASRKREDLARCRELLGAPSPPTHKPESWVAAFTRIFGRDPLLCPVCKIGRMVVREVLPPLRV